MAKKRIDVEIGVKNKIAAGLKSAKASIKGFARGVYGAMRSVGASLMRAGAVGVGAFVGLIKHGNAFRASMAEVKTMLGDDKTMLPELTKQVRELAGEFGLAKETLAKGLYQALSAGVPAGNAIDFLTVASKAAVGGVTDVATAVDGLTSVINAYGIEASRVSQVSDIMFSVVKEGKINFEELSQNIGNIAPFAKTAGVGIEDLSAMIATLVKVDKPERAMTSLRQAMVFAAKAGKPLMQVLNEFEGKSLEELLAAGVTQKSAAGIAIMSGNMGVLRKEMEIFKNTAGAANAAFEDVSAVQGWQRLWQTTLGIVSDVGAYFDSMLSPSIESLRIKIKEFSESGEIFLWVDNIKAAISTILPVLNSVKKGFGLVIDKVRETSAFWGTIAGGGSLDDAATAMSTIKADMEKDKAKRLQEIRIKYGITKTEKIEAATNVASRPQGKIGLGNMTSVAPQVGGISDSTSMLSTGDLFTMMQTGSDSKATMVSEQQKTNEKLDKLIELTGGVE